jgi:ribosomal protein L18E
MGMRHELELLMLKERSNHYNIEIEKINKLLVEDTTGVVAGDLVVEESLKESNNKNSKKKK